MTERIVYSEEVAPDRRVKLVAAGDVDELMLSALESFIAHRRKQIAEASNAPR